MPTSGSRAPGAARLTPPEAKARKRLVPAPLALAAETNMSVLTCARIVARRDLPRLNDADRITAEPRAHGSVTHVRYERERPGELYLIA